MVAGYNIYYGGESRNYTNVVDVGLRTSLTISNLAPGAAYSFAATAYTAVGLESEYSTEVNYVVPAVPVNAAPTLNQPSDLAINQDAGLQTVNLSGISSGSGSENQTLTVTAFSGNTQLIPNPAVNYTSPQATGTLTFTPVSASFGTSIITVMVDDGGAVSNTVIRTFTVAVNAVNTPPTLDPIADVVLNQDSGSRVVNLTGIKAGAPTETQPLTVTATSSNPSLIPHPAVSYASPNPTATLTLTPVTNAFGSAAITVVVSDGQALNSTTNRTFNVTVNQVVAPSDLLTNAVVSPNQFFRLGLNPPVTNGHKFTFALDSSAPADAKISNRKGVPALIWTPTPAYASTTNLITIQATDTVTPTFTTNQYLQVIVLDYLALIPGKAVVQAGQTGSLPLALDCSDGVTNVTFLLNWPTDRFSEPSLSMTSPNTTSGSVQVQGSNLLVRVQTSPRQVIEGSNIVARLNFRALANQSSAFVGMPLANVTALKPLGTSYINTLGQRGQIIVVNDVPLLQSTLGAAGRRDLLLYGKVGTSYQLQYNTNLTGVSAANWKSLLSYPQTNLEHNLTVDSAPPIIFYRLQQQ